MHACTHTHTESHTHTLTHTRTQSHTHTHTESHTHTHKDTHACLLTIRLTHTRHTYFSGNCSGNEQQVGYTEPTAAGGSGPGGVVEPRELAAAAGLRGGEEGEGGGGSSGAGAEAEV